MFMSSYHFPELQLPFGTMANPEATGSDRRTLDWVRYFDLIKTSGAFRKFDASKFALLAALAYPDASKEDLLLINDWLAWRFVQDDHFDEARVGRQTRRMQAYVDAAISLLRQPRVSTVREDGALLASLSDLWLRLRVRLNADLTARFMMVLEAHITSSLWELDNRAYGYTPTENEYIVIRRDTTGFRVSALLLEMTLGDSLPTLAREHPILRKMQDLSNDVIAWTNDLYSFEKEAKRKETHNLVLILRDSMGLQQAIDAVAARIQNSAQQFVELEAALPSFGAEADTVVGKYVGGLKTWMAGHLAWIQLSGRYEHEQAQSSDSQTSDLNSIAG